MGKRGQPSQRPPETSTTGHRKGGGTSGDRVCVLLSRNIEGTTERAQARTVNVVAMETGDLPSYVESPVGNWSSPLH